MAIRQPAESVIDQAHHEGVSLRGAAASLTNLREANEFRTIQAIMAISWELLVCHASALGISGQIWATKEGATRAARWMHASCIYTVPVLFALGEADKDQRQDFAKDVRQEFLEVDIGETRY